MQDFLITLQENIETIKNIGDKIESGDSYIEDVKEYLPLLNQTITDILKMNQQPQAGLDINQDFILQVLHDIIYGMENEDSVFLLDVLRYGLLQIYLYVEAELIGDECYE